MLDLQNNNGLSIIRDLLHYICPHNTERSNN